MRSRRDKMTGLSKHRCIKRHTVMKKQNRQTFKKMNYMQLYRRCLKKLQMNNYFKITKNDYVLKLYDSKFSNFIQEMLKYNNQLFDMKSYNHFITKHRMKKYINITNKYDSMITNESKFSKFIWVFPMSYTSYILKKCIQNNNPKRRRLMWRRIETSVDENKGGRGTLNAVGQSPQPRITPDKRISYRRFQYSMKRDHSTRKIYHVNGLLNIRGSPPVTYRLFMDRLPMLHPFLTRKSAHFGADVVRAFRESVYRGNYPTDPIIRHGPDTSADENAANDETTLNETIYQCSNQHSTEYDPSTEISLGDGGLFTQTSSVTYPLFRDRWARIYSFINDGFGPPDTRAFSGVSLIDNISADPIITDGHGTSTNETTATDETPGAGVNYNGPQITLTETIPQWGYRHSTERDPSTEISLGDGGLFTQTSPSVTYPLFRDRWARISSFQIDDFGPPEILAFSGFSHIDNISADPIITDGHGTSTNEITATDETPGAGVNYNGPQITLPETIPRWYQHSTEIDLSTEEICLRSGGLFTQISPSGTHHETQGVNFNQLQVALTDTIPPRSFQGRAECDVSTGEISLSLYHW